MTNNTQPTESCTLRERCEARHPVVNELIKKYRYPSAIRELESIIKMIKDA